MPSSDPKIDFSLEYDIAQLNEVTAALKKRKTFNPTELIEATNKAHNLLVRLKRNAQFLDDNNELANFLGVAASIVEQLHQVGQEESKKFASPNALMKKLTDATEYYLNKALSKQNQQRLRKVLGLISWIDGVVDVTTMLPYYFVHADRYEKVTLILSATILLAGMAATLALFCTPLVTIYPFIAPAIEAMVLFSRVTFTQAIHNTIDRYEDKGKVEATLATLEHIEKGMLALTEKITEYEKTHLQYIKDNIDQLEELAIMLQTSKGITPQDLQRAMLQSLNVMQILKDASAYIPDNTELQPFLASALEIVQQLQIVAQEEESKYAVPSAILNKITKNFDNFVKHSVSERNYGRFRKLTRYFSGFDGVVELCTGMHKYFPYASKSKQIGMVLSATLLVAAFAVSIGILCSPAAPAIPFIIPLLAATVAVSKFLYNKAVEEAKIKYADRHEVVASIEQFAKIELGMQDLYKAFPSTQKLLEGKPKITSANEADKLAKKQSHAEKFKQQSSRRSKPPPQPIERTK